MKSSSGRAAVEARIREMVAAWTHADDEAFVRCFTDDAEYVTGQGIWFRGRDGIRELLAGQADAFEVRVDGDVAIRLVGEQAAHAVFRWLTDGEPGGGVTGCVLVHRNGEWQIEALHSSYAG